MIAVGVLVSGRGSNLAALLDASRAPECPYSIACVISDQPSALALQTASRAKIPSFCHEKAPSMKKAEYEQGLIGRLREHGVQVVALAGFMRILGKTFLAEYGGRVLNIHPSLLPAFPGLHAQEQAHRAGVRHAGCTVHLVDAGMDTGPILDQACLRVDPAWDAQELAAHILELEHRLYPETLARFCRGEFRLEEGRVRVFAPPAWLRPVWNRFAASHFGRVTPVLSSPAGVPRTAVSACLCGFPCRYDAQDKRNESWLAHLQDHELLPVCPEVLAGLGIPRPRIQYENENVNDILQDPIIWDETGMDVTVPLKDAVSRIVQWCRENRVERVILKESSPSCGVRRTPWRGRKVEGRGILAAALERAGFPIVSSEAEPDS